MTGRLFTITVTDGPILRLDDAVTLAGNGEYLALGITSTFDANGYTQVFTMLRRPEIEAC